MSKIPEEWQIIPKQDLVDIIGMSFSQASVHFKWCIRASKVAGNYMALTMDLRNDRINVEIENGVIVAAEVY